MRHGSLLDVASCCGPANLNELLILPVAVNCEAQVSTWCCHFAVEVSAMDYQMIFQTAVKTVKHSPAL